MPFGAITLSHSLNASRLVSTSQNIFVTCDDKQWLKEEIANTSTNLKIFSMNPPENHRKNSQGAVQYMAAIEIGRTCHAMVGHEGSAVTRFFRNIFCMRHKNLVATCPPIYDFSRGRRR
jgi:hypothetical protein